MIKHSTEYAQAVTADSRRQYVRAVFDLVDPDAQVDGVDTNSESVISLTDQVKNRGLTESSEKITTLELNRWALDGSWGLRPNDPADRTGQVGWESDFICDASGTFSTPYPYIELEFSGVDILQAVTVLFSRADYNGIGVDFQIELYSGDTLLHTSYVTDNEKSLVPLEGFTVYFPTRARLTVTKWSLPYRRARVIRFMLGLYEEWDTTIIKGVDVYSEVTFSGLRIPYSTCTITIHNENHRFDPYAPNSLFQSIEDRQHIKVEFGIRLQNGEMEWIPAGTYYQQSAGWKLQDLTISWDLLDIIGALTKRLFVVPEELPATVSGWVEAIMASLGRNFNTRYIVDDDVKELPLTAVAEDIDGKFCGEILRFLCMATNTWPRQDFSTGKLRVGKLERLEGNRITLDNMVSFPVMSANEDIADITFQLDSGEVVFPGNNTNSEKSLNVNNPFVHTTEDARTAVISCLFEYGGRSFDVTSRGNPTSECGDIQSVDTQFLTTISARLYKQQLKMENGIMRNLPSHLVQSPNDSAYTNKTILTGSGTYTAETDGEFKITLIGGGDGGMGGGGGVMYVSYDGTTSGNPTSGGEGGLGGRVFIVELSAQAGQTFDFFCGTGGYAGKGGREEEDGEPGGSGTDTSFGVFTSANGNRYDMGLMDIQSGAVYAQPGGNTGDSVSGNYGSGGAGGKFGEDGLTIYRTNPETGEVYRKVRSRPTDGEDGQPGMEGCVIVEWS